MANNVSVSVEVAFVSIIYTTTALVCILCIIYWTFNRIKYCRNPNTSGSLARITFDQTPRGSSGSIDNISISRCQRHRDTLNLLTLTTLAIVPVSLCSHLIIFISDTNNSDHSNHTVSNIVHFYDRHRLTVQFCVTAISYPFAKYLTWILL